MNPFVVNEASNTSAHCRKSLCSRRKNNHEGQPLSFAAEPESLYPWKPYKTFRTQGDLLNGKLNETWQVQHIALCTEERHADSNLHHWTQNQNSAITMLILQVCWGQWPDSPKQNPSQIKSLHLKWLIENQLELPQSDSEMISWFST